MTKTAYSYDPATGEYTGVTTANESPLEPGVYLLPAHSTEVPPPEAGDHEAALWDGEAWDLIPDWRGETRYRTDTGEKVHITDLGPLPGDVTDVPPPDGEHVWEGGAWVLPWTVRVARKKADIAAARYEAEIGGVAVGGMLVRTDRESQALITGAALKAMQDPDYTCRWKTPDGFVTLTSVQITAVADAVRAHVQGCFDREDILLTAVDALVDGDVAGLAAIVWPE